MYTIIGTLVLHILFFFSFPVFGYTKEYLAVWGEGSPFSNKQEAINALLLQAVVDIATSLVHVNSEMKEYAIYGTYFSPLFLRYIKGYTEKTPQGENQIDVVDNAPKHVDEALVINTDNAQRVMLEIVVDEKEVRNTLNMMGVFSSNNSIDYTRDYSISFSHTISSKEQNIAREYIQAVASLSAVVIQDISKNKIHITKEAEGKYIGTFSQGTIVHSYSSKNLQEVLGEMYLFYFSLLNAVSIEETSVVYSLEVGLLTDTEDIFELDTLFTQELEDSVTDIALANIRTDDVAMSAVWMCSVHEKTLFLKTIKRILFSYPHLSYTLTGDIVNNTILEVNK